MTSLNQNLYPNLVKIFLILACFIAAISAGVSVFLLPPNETGDLCKKYRTETAAQDYDVLKPINIEGHASTFDPSWAAVKMDQYFLPAPSVPSKQDLDSRTIGLGDQSWSASVAPGDERLVSGLGSAAVNYMNRQNAFSTYDFFRLAHGGFLESCEGLDSDQDLNIKVMLSKVRKGAHDLTRPDKILVSDDAKLVAYLSRKPDSSYPFSVNLHIHRAKGKSDIIIISFKRQEIRDKFQSFLPHIRNQKFFAKGQIIPLDEL